MGRSRSATLVMMYILYKMIVDQNMPDGIDTDTVYKFVQHRRNVADPNKGFVTQLNLFEQKVRSGEMFKKVTEFKSLGKKRIDKLSTLDTIDKLAIPSGLYT